MNFCRTDNTVSTSSATSATAISTSAAPEDLSDRVVLVTGGDRGVGFEIARLLLQRGAHVIIAGPDPRRGRAAAMYLRADTESERVAYLELDLTDWIKVRKATAAFLDMGLPLHVLIHAANYSTRKATGSTPDGVDAHLAVNHVGPHLMNQHLMKKLAESAPGRIVYLCDAAWAKEFNSPTQQINLPRSLIEQEYDAQWPYSRSRMAAHFNMKAWAERLRQGGVLVNAAEVTLENWRRDAEAVLAVAFGERSQKTTGKVLDGACQAVKMAKALSDETEFDRVIRWTEKVSGTKELDAWKRYEAMLQNVQAGALSATSSQSSHMSQTSVAAASASSGLPVSTGRMMGAR